NGQGTAKERDGEKSGTARWESWPHNGGGIPCGLPAHLWVFSRRESRVDRAEGTAHPDSWDHDGSETSGNRRVSRAFLRGTSGSDGPCRSLPDDSRPIFTNGPDLGRAGHPTGGPVASPLD